MQNFLIKIMFGLIFLKECGKNPEKSVILVNNSAIVLLHCHVYSSILSVFVTLSQNKITSIEKRSQECMKYAQGFSLKDSHATAAVACKKARGVCSVASLMAWRVCQSSRCGFLEKSISSLASGTCNFYT